MIRSFEIWFVVDPSAIVVSMTSPFISGQSDGSARRKRFTKQEDELSIGSFSPSVERLNEQGKDCRLVGCGVPVARSVPGSWHPVLRAATSDDCVASNW